MARKKKAQSGRFTSGVLVGFILGCVTVAAGLRGVQSLRAGVGLDGDAASRSKLVAIDAMRVRFDSLWAMVDDFSEVELSSYPSARGGGLRVAGAAKTPAAFHFVRVLAYNFAYAPEVQCDLDLAVTCPEVAGASEVPIAVSVAWVRERSPLLW